MEGYQETLQQVRAMGKHTGPMTRPADRRGLIHEEIPKAERILSGQQRTGRNQTCTCGSGKKFKLCCMNRQRRAIVAFGAIVDAGTMDLPLSTVASMVHGKDMG